MFLYFWLVLVELYKSLIHIILSEVGVLPFNQGWVLHVVTASIELRRDPWIWKKRLQRWWGWKWAIPVCTQGFPWLWSWTWNQWHGRAGAWLERVPIAEETAESSCCGPATEEGTRPGKDLMMWDWSFLLCLFMCLNRALQLNAPFFQTSQISTDRKCMPRKTWMSSTKTSCWRSRKGEVLFAMCTKVALGCCMPCML